MTKPIDWTFSLGGRRGRLLSSGTPGPVLSPARERELDQPTWMRRKVRIEGWTDRRRGQ